MTDAQATAFPDLEPEDSPRPETLEEAAGRRLLVSFDALTRIDLALLRLLRTRGHAPPVERLVLRYTNTGEHATLWHAIALLGILLDRRRRAGRRQVYVRAMVAITIAQGANFLAKNLIARARPLIEDLPPLVPTISGLSTPSAHASTSFAGASALSDALPGPPLWAAATVMAL
jgi:membrane-associated phospholipid phosphatase